MDVVFQHVPQLDAGELRPIGGQESAGTHMQLVLLQYSNGTSHSWWIVMSCRHAQSWWLLTSSSSECKSDRSQTPARSCRLKTGT